MNNGYRKYVKDEIKDNRYKKCIKDNDETMLFDYDEDALERQLCFQLSLLIQCFCLRILYKCDHNLKVIVHLDPPLPSYLLIWVSTISFSLMMPVEFEQVLRVLHDHNQIASYIYTNNFCFNTILENKDIIRSCADVWLKFCYNFHYIFASDYVFSYYNTLAT